VLKLERGGGNMLKLKSNEGIVLATGEGRRECAGNWKGMNGICW
jgi:hypothetical protein